MTVFAISFVIYTIGIVLIGVLAGRHAGKDDESFFLGGRTLGPWVAALSASASSESGWLTIGLVGWAFTSGASAYWILPGVLIGYVFNWVVLAGPLRDQTERLGAITLPDYLSLRFGEGSGPNGRAPVLRLLAVAVIILAMWLYVAAQFAAAGKAFESAFAIDYRWGVGIGGAIVLFYTVIGGFRAACWTDFAQAIVMFVALGLFPIWALLSSGGYGAMSESLASVEGLNTFWPEKTGLAFMGFLFGSGALGINFGYPGQPHVLIRFIALRKRSEAVKAAVIAFTWGAVVLWGAVTLGLLVRAYTIDGAEWTAPLAAELAGEVSGAGETGLVLAAQALLPGVLGGVVLAAVLAAICSTADSQLVVAASAAASDVYARLFKHQGAGPWINRLTVLVLGIAAMLLVLDPGIQVFTFVLSYGWAVLGAAFGPQVLLALFWKRASRVGAIGGMMTGVVVALGWKMGFDNSIGGVEIYNLPLAFIAALGANAILSLAVPDTPSDYTSQGG